MNYIIQDTCHRNEALGTESKTDPSQESIAETLSVILEDTDMKSEVITIEYNKVFNNEGGWTLNAESLHL